MLKILIYEDNADLRESLAVMLCNHEGFNVCDSYGNCKNIASQIAEHEPDIIMMDIDMPEVNGIEGLKIVKNIRPEINVIMLTVFESNEYIFDAICAGATGYLLKKSRPSDIIHAIENVQNGGSVMTPSIARKVLQFFPKNIDSTKQEDNTETLSQRESTVLEYLTKGYTYRMVAYELGISTDTVRTYIRRIYTKLQVHSNTEAVAWAMKHR